MQELLKYLGDFDPLTELTEPFVKDFEKAIRINDFQKGHYLLKSGSVSEHMHYIVKGCVECYIGSRSRKETLWFMVENEIALFKHSYYDQIPSEGSIVALEDTQAFSISYKDSENLYKQYPFSERLGRKVTEYYHKRSDIKSYILYPRSAEERFDRFNKYRPDIVKRVPQRRLASFLGIREETLSRVMTERLNKE